MRVLAAFLCALACAAAYPAGAATHRSERSRTAFARTHACPSTGKFSTHCPGYVIDHRWPLCAGGEDAPDNMQWEEKLESYRKDLLERRLCALIRDGEVPAPTSFNQRARMPAPIV